MTSNLQNFNKAQKFFVDFDNFILLTHKNLDIDALGSLLGLTLVLENYGKRVTPISFDKIPSIFSSFPGVYKVAYKLPNSLFKKNLSIILLDCADFNRTGFEKKLFTDFPILIIDHHPSGEKKTILPIEREKYSSQNSIVIIAPDKSSTAEILFNLIGFLKLNITPQIATCLLAGIIGDTGGFRHSNTTSGVMEIAARLVVRGARVDKISRQIFSNTPLATLRIIGRALERIETDPSSGMALSLLSEDDLKECGATTNDLSGIANILANVGEAKFILFLAEYKKNRIKGSLRSERFKGVDVAKIAHLFGGGGHKFASGFEIAGNLKESVKNITERITRHLNI